MQRVTISIEEPLAEAFDKLVSETGYQNRSEAVRDLVRQAVEERRLEAAPGAYCVASLSYVYDYRTRDIASRLAQIGHDNHDLVVSTTQVPLDHETCFASTILKGSTEAVRALSDRIRAERGVRFGAINLISVDPNDSHSHAGGHQHHGHAHLSPHRG
jgi:CopG family transcriptional regulator, nickel-responsive regulator